MFHSFIPRRGRRLRALTALAAALALLFVLAAASRHWHRDSIDADACAVCAVGLHQFQGAAAAAAPPPRLVLLPYRIAAAVAYRSVCAHARLLPPSCGPPAAAVSPL